MLGKMIVTRVTLNEERFVMIGNHASFAISTALLRTHPVFSKFYRFGANVRVIVAQYFLAAALAGHVGELCFGTSRIFSVLLSKNNNFCTVIICKRRESDRLVKL